MASPQDFAQFLYNDESSTCINAFPSQNLLTKIQTQEHSFDWVIGFDELGNLFAGVDGNSHEILISPYFFLGQEVSKPCKWYLKIKRSTEPVPAALQVNHGGTQSGFSLYLVLDEVLWSTYTSSDQLVLKTKLSIINKKTEVLHSYDDDWKCFTKLDQEEWIGSPVFAVFEKILLEKGTLAEDDKIRIRLDIIIYGSPSHLQISTGNKLSPQLVINPITFDPILSLWDVKDHADLIINCRKDDKIKEFLVHRAFISQSSPILDQMIGQEMDKLSKEMAEDELLGNKVGEGSKFPRIDLQDVEPEVMEVILKHIYCNHLNFPRLQDDESDPESSNDCVENIPFEIADKCIQMTGQYQLRGTRDAFFKCFLLKCNQAENFSRLLYLACKYTPGPKVKEELQQIYQKYFTPTYSSFSNLRKEELFKKSMAEFPIQFLDIFFGIHE